MTPFAVTLLTAALLAPLSVASAADKPAIAFKSRSIDVSVTVGSELKAYPGLYDNLLAEGRREADKWRATADADRKDTPDIFADGRRYAFERSYQQRSSIGRYVSVVRNDYYNTLGAHPNSDVNTIMWDAEAQRRVSIRPLFKETTPRGPTLTRIAKAIRATLAVEKKARIGETVNPDKDEGLASVEPDLLKMGAVALVPSIEPGRSAGIVFYFPPYAVGSYAEGPYAAFVPWRTFRDDLSPEGAALFGGDRPAGDEKND